MSVITLVDDLRALTSRISRVIKIA